MRNVIFGLLVVIGGLAVLWALFLGALATYDAIAEDSMMDDMWDMMNEMSGMGDMFKQLAINDSYGLQIIDSQGEVVEGRSAGQEQVVALSLIAALNRNARRGAPVIMDTPFGRLDPEHRTNILQFLSRLAGQIFLLVHGGEINDADLSVIASSIQEQFDLHRDDTDRTTIIPRSTR